VLGDRADAHITAGAVRALCPRAWATAGARPANAFAWHDRLVVDWVRLGRTQGGS
jgi:hypothetical protein